MRRLRALLDAAAIAALRKYVVDRIGLRPPQNEQEEKEFEQRLQGLLSAIEEERVDIWDKMTEKEREKARSLAQKFPEYLKYINTQNVLKWLRSDVPIVYGVIVGHPKGREWLERLIDSFVASLLDVELVEDEGGR